MSGALDGADTEDRRLYGEEERAHDPERCHEDREGAWGEVRRLQVHGLSRDVATLHGALSPASRRVPSRTGIQSRFRRQLHSWLAGHPRQRHVDHSGRRHHRDGPLHGRTVHQLHLQHRGSQRPRRSTAVPRNIAQKAEAYLKSTGIADTAFIGPEAEFFIFDDIRQRLHDRTPATTSSTRAEGQWNTGRVDNPNLGRQGSLQGRLLPGSPHGQHERHPFRDGPGHGAGWDRCGGATPRGGHRRRGGDRHEVQQPDQDRRQFDVVQVHHQERGAQMARP